jgi:oxygen-dependent protoporphyrinogen oxidase
MWRKGRANKNQTGVSGARYSLFLSFDQGMKVLVDALGKNIANLAESGLAETEIRLNTSVSGVERGVNNASWILRSSAGIVSEFDAVCLATPSYGAAKLLSETAPQLAAKLGQIRFASTATINLAYRGSDISHKLDGFGFVVPFVEKRSVIACTFSSIKFQGRAPKDHVLLRAFVGGALQPELLSLDDDEITRRVEEDLEQLLGIKVKPLFAEVSRWMNSMPQYQVGHLDRVAAIENALAQLPGMVLAGNSYRGAGIPDCIRSGEAAAQSLIERISDGASGRRGDGETR